MLKIMWKHMGKILLEKVCHDKFGLIRGLIGHVASLVTFRFDSVVNMHDCF